MVCCGGLQHWLLSGHTDCPVCRASINLSSPLDGVWLTTAERAEGINDSINTVGVAGTVTLEGLEASAEEGLGGWTRQVHIDFLSAGDSGGGGGCKGKGRGDKGEDEGGVIRMVATGDEDGSKGECLTWTAAERFPASGAQGAGAGMEPASAIDSSIDTLHWSRTGADGRRYSMVWALKPALVELTPTNAKVGMRVFMASDDDGHTGAGTLLGWKVDGERTGDTSGGLRSDGYCRVDFDDGGAWNVNMSECTLIANDRTEEKLGLSCLAATARTSTEEAGEALHGPSSPEAPDGGRRGPTRSRRR